MTLGETRKGTGWSEACALEVGVRTQVGLRLGGSGLWDTEV